ncbi:MAG: GxxExxY protein [Verrucomicrobiota bacterium]
MDTDSREPEGDNRDPETYAIIGAAMEVHRELGSGFLENVYHDALIKEFKARKIKHIHEFPVPIYYKEELLKTPYRADFLCGEDVIVEVQAIKILTDVETSQVIHYLKATGLKRALLFNFGARTLQYKRLSN